MSLRGQPNTHAAEIVWNARADGPDVISFDGMFNEGDNATFRQVASPSGRAVIVLNSGGGNLVAGLEIGRAIRLKGFATAVPANALCASACALTWLAGSPRLLADDSKLGFHAAYRMIDGHASEYGAANALVGAYLNQLGLSDKAVVYVTSAPPEGVEWLTAATASDVGIAYEAIAAEAPAVSEPSIKLPRDPMSATTMFYSALAAADGEAASAMVVPEKRGKGPFNEQSIHAFYGAMAVPMKLTGTTLRGADDVRASYEYTTDKGRACRGRADVQTVYAYGRTLISKIKALDGC
ncbi:hypothetical protein [Rhizobium tumorigenes]|uniref:Uncharacterized protein n=1 Tax=Rhizobium tumorigenes TaxID=2041385 RepID=A0AAF1KCS9_9HYPH|nr:hypothetical protein [Rhizobium tumorigenes]WFR97591.1 hypothetical protein PR017_20525 [Rhizobium tumorigenes]WFS03193.1 hypothetical protein PR016_21270 [Rhizobium tumorigenes]